MGLNITMIHTVRRKIWSRSQNRVILLYTGDILVNNFIMSDILGTFEGVRKVRSSKFLPYCLLMNTELTTVTGEV